MENSPTNPLATSPELAWSMLTPNPQRVPSAQEIKVLAQTDLYLVALKACKDLRPQRTAMKAASSRLSLVTRAELLPKLPAHLRPLIDMDALASALLASLEALFRPALLRSKTAAQPQIEMQEVSTPIQPAKEKGEVQTSPLDLFDEPSSHSLDDVLEIFFDIVAGQITSALCTYWRVREYDPLVTRACLRRISTPITLAHVAASTPAGWTQYLQAVCLVTPSASMGRPTALLFNALFDRLPSTLIDAMLTESCWTTGSSLADFVANDPTRLVQVQARARFLATQLEPKRPPSTRPPEPRKSTQPRPPTVGGMTKGAGPALCLNCPGETHARGSCPKYVCPGCGQRTPGHTWRGCPTAPEARKWHEGRKSSSLPVLGEFRPRPPRQEPAPPLPNL
jgi:hypothetical protein